MALASAIERFLRPIIGVNGAHRLILVYCSRYNIQPQDIEDGDLIRLGEFLRDNLILFVGHQQAQHVLTELLTVQQNVTDS